MTSREARQKFITDNYADISRIAQGSGVHPATIATVAILESSGKVGGSWYPGQSQLAKKAKNYFGIKATPDWDGKIYTIEHREFINGNWITNESDFRAYNSLKESVADYIKFLHENPRYTKALSAQTPRAQFEELQSAGYATDPHYLEKLTTIYNRYFAPGKVSTGNNNVVLYFIGAYLLTKTL